MRYGEIAGVTPAPSRIVLGAGSFDEERRADAWRLLDHYLTLGGSVVDTAAVYGNGASERVLGEWLARSGSRDDVVILTKGGHPSLPDWTDRLTPEEVGQDLDASLARLKVDRIDLYMLHRDDERIPVDELVDLLARCVESGKVKAVAVSNWTWPRVEDANLYAARRGAPSLAVNSVHYSLAVPHASVAPGTVSLCGDDAALAWYRRSGVPVLAWSSQAKGFFSGRFAPTVHDDPHVEKVYYHQDNWRRLERATRLAARLGCTPSQVALAWLLEQPVQVFAAVGTTKLEHLDECLGALDVQLTSSEIEWLNLERDEPN
ncbi:MAG TPA: aldo/keto reductase [Acidimicrobiales bacterium]|nr:aldo/keto reductase [Acidimicrobiales bacterium]